MSLHPPPGQQTQVGGDRWADLCRDQPAVWVLCVQYVDDVRLRGGDVERARRIAWAWYVDRVGPGGVPRDR